ncbi:MAG: glycoside hydrolase family 92 protein, partial [Lewinella sp.]|nr:glycoside hydrolase family 92 protein [Lewinella sp.]
MKIAQSLLYLLLVLSACTSPPDSTPGTASSNTSPVDMVYPLLDAANSRWFFFNSATRPFGMVNLSPDTQLGGAWGSGYRYDTDTIKGFSHIHAWQLSGVSVMPVVYEPGEEAAIMDDYYSRFDHAKETVTPGYHKVELERYSITTELSSTKRVGWHRYAFPGGQTAGLVLNLGGTLGPSGITGGNVQLSDDGLHFSGELINAPTRRRPKNCKVFFYAASNRKISKVHQGNEGRFLLEFPAEEKTDPTVLKIGISYTSINNAQLNLEIEAPGWDFDEIVNDSQREWNDLLGRIRVEGNTERQQRRFYTDLWHALQGRRVISDVNGAYPDNTGDQFRIGQIPLNEQGKPRFNHYNSDSFWGAQWTINTLWGLAYPDIYEEFVQSLLLYYQDGGLLPRGPSGGNYTHVMTGASSTPFV